MKQSWRRYGDFVKIGKLYWNSACKKGILELTEHDSCKASSNLFEAIS
jgi:hypothetical protein